MACCVNVDVMAAKRQKNSERDEKFELMGVVDSTYFCTEDYGKRKKYRVKNLVLDLTPNGPRSSVRCQWCVVISCAWCSTE